MLHLWTGLWFDFYMDVHAGTKDTGLWIDCGLMDLCMFDHVKKTWICALLMSHIVYIKTRHISMKMSCLKSNWAFVTK